MGMLAPSVNLEKSWRRSPHHVPMGMPSLSLDSGGRQYQKAANLLYEADKTLTTPIYFLYLHAIELVLKAYLRCEPSYLGRQEAKAPSDRDAV
jgi:hypothetical protein